MIDYKKIGEKIANRRTSLNITQEQLAEKLQTSPSYISNLENGVYGFSFERIVEIAKELNLSFDYLFDNEINSREIKEDAKIKEIANLMQKLDETNQEKAYKYIENFLNTMIQIEQ